MLPHYTPALVSDFWSHVRIVGACWEWQAARDGDGYGFFRKHGAHRISYWLTWRFWPGKWWVLHRCDTPSCVRPSHLFLGTVADNNRDKAEKGRAGGGARKPYSLKARDFAHVCATCGREFTGTKRQQYCRPTCQPGRALKSLRA